MGRYKELMIQQLEEDEHEEMAEWIYENVGEDIEEDSVAWYEAQEKYYEHLDSEYIQYQIEKEDRFEEKYLIKNKTRFEIFNQSLENVSTLNTIYSNKPEADMSLKIMLWGHIVAATEGYLFFSFIDKVMADESFIERLVETDPEFSNRKVSFSEIYRKRSSLQSDVKEYLRTLIFHNIPKVKILYKNVLGIDLEDVIFLYEAIAKRHDCVHRAGYDKDGKFLNISKIEVEQLVEKSKEFVNRVEKGLLLTI